MPVPSVITDLTSVASGNFPAGGDTVFPELDNYLRAHAGFIKQNYDAQRVETVAALRALPAPGATKTVTYLEGYYAAGDGGGSALIWIPASTTTDNGGTVFRPDSAPATGRWERYAEKVPAKWFGCRFDGSSDDILPLRSLVSFAHGSGFHRPVIFPPGRAHCSDTLTIDAATDSTASTSHRNMIWEGAGGMGTEPGTEIRFDVSDAAKDGLQILSAFGVQISGIAFTSNTAIKNVVNVAANVDPAFSGSMIEFKNCYFNSFTSTPAEAVIAAVNWKLVAFRACWLGVRVAGDKCMIVGGNTADNGSYLQQGELNNFEVTQSYIFGVMAIKRARNFQINNNSFIESYSSRIDVIGDEDSHGGVIEANYFTGVTADTDTDAAITIGNYESAGGEQAGCIRISNNRFRYRALGIRVKSKTPVLIENNHFRARSSASVGVQIDSTAEKVTLGSNDFDDMYSAAALAVDDQRFTPWTDQPTNNVNKDIVANFVLSAAATSISATNTTQLIGSVSGVKLRGGKYRARMKVSVRNTDAVDALPFAAFLKYRDQANTLHEIGVIGQSYVGADNGQYIAGSGRGSLYVERIIYLGGTTLASPTLSAFELYVRNLSGAATPATGQVDGGATELGAQILTWFQVEEYRD